MTIKKSDFLLNFMMICLGATVGRRIGDPYLKRHLAAKSADLMLVNLPHCRKILRVLFRKIFLQFFLNSSSILPRVAEFGASGLAWRRIVEGIIVEKSWKHLVNAAPEVFTFSDFLSALCKRSSHKIGQGIG
jgi:hypothetical protein